MLANLFVVALVTGLVSTASAQDKIEYPDPAGVEVFACNAGIAQNDNDPSRGASFLRYEFLPDANGTLPGKGSVAAAKNGVNIVAHEFGTADGMEASARLAAQFRTKLKSVEFGLASDSMGAHFFVDYCFTGPAARKFDSSGCKKDGPDKGKGCEPAAPPKYVTTALLTPRGTQLLDDADYIKASALRGQWELACSFRSSGGAPRPPNNLTGLSDIAPRPTTLGSLANGTNAWNASPGATSWVGSLGGTLLRSSGNTDITSWDNDLLSLFGTASNPLALSPDAGSGVQRNAPPEFCLLRLYFQEKRSADPRPFDRLDARLSLLWSVSPAP